MEKVSDAAMRLVTRVKMLEDMVRDREKQLYIRNVEVDSLISTMSDNQIERLAWIHQLNYWTDAYEGLAAALERLQEEYNELRSSRDDWRRECRREIKNADYWNNLYQEKMKDIEHLQDCLAAERKRLREQREASKLSDYEWSG